MDYLDAFYSFLPSGFLQITSIVSFAFAALFMYFSSKYRNFSLKPSWYIAAFFFPVFTVIFFFSKRKAYKNINVKVCESCGTTYPVNFEYCSQCLAKLPEYDEKKKKSQKALATVFAILFVIFGVLNFASGIIPAVSSFDFENNNDAESRIGFTDSDGNLVYYDRNGEAYYDALEVVIYDRDGNMYYYAYQDGECFYKDDGMVSLWEEDDYIPAYNCYVDKDGYFVDMSDENDLMIVTDELPEEKHYFDTFYTDGKGNAYYPAMLASWNSEGELIISAQQMN